MGRGSGNIGRTNKVEPPAAPTVTAAQNGVGLNGTIVELGFSLIRDTDIELAGFDFSISQATNKKFFIDAAGLIVSLGDINNANLGTTLIIDDVAPEIRGTANNTGVFFASQPLSMLGDHQAAGNGTTLLIDVNNELIEFLSGGQLGAKFLSFDDLNRTYNFGDLAGAGNQVNFTMDDASQQVGIAASTFTMLFLDQANQIYQLGPSAMAGGSYFEVNGTAQTFATNSFGTTSGLLIDNGTFNYAFGDFGLIGNGLNLNIDDNNRMVLISILASNFLTLDINSGNFLFGDVNGFISTLYFQVDSTNSRVSTTGFSEIIGSNGTNYTNNAGAAAGTLLNAPVAGNPTKWIPINDNGTIRNIPAW